MVKLIKFIRGLLFTLTLSAICLIVYGFYSVPDNLYSVTDKLTSINEIYTVRSYEARDCSDNSEGKSYNVEISLMNVIPVKSSQLTVNSRKYVSVSGELFGLRLFTDGVVIVDIDKFDSEAGFVSPAESAGLKKGDIIYSINSVRTKDSATVSQIFQNSAGQPLEIEYIRDEKHYKTTLTLSFSQAEQKFKAGMWIRDSAAGIGTMTFYNLSNGTFAGLGHGVCDVDTGDILPLSDGDIVSAYVSGCYKGKSGQAGELCGVFNSSSKGVLLENCSIGVYGTVKNTQTTELMPVATSEEVKTGKAHIVCTVDENGPTHFEIEIVKISSNNNKTKNLTVKVTDGKLIEKTGGIVQGMSGSPIIQNGMLVGAITHVFINDPTQGYAIFAETMLLKSESIN